MDSFIIENKTFEKFPDITKLEINTNNKITPVNNNNTNNNDEKSQNHISSNQEDGQPNFELRITAEKSTFHSALGGIVSCLGSAVGTGNIWRFPRILAMNSQLGGSLTFYIAWLLVLFSWSIPVILIEYSLGRFTRNSPPLACSKFLGQKFMWIGGWMIAIVFFLSAYYPVILGWCLYYFYISCSVKSLPSTEAEGITLFNDYAMHSYWPVLTQVLSIILTGICLVGGIKWIERANFLLVPLLLCIVIFTFGWSLTRKYAEVGIVFLFTPTWKSFANPELWIAAAGQNAFDTGAGMAVLASYATFMNRESKIVSYSILIPIINNLVSFYASITIFSTVFSTIIQTTPTATRSAIVKTLQSLGPGSTGLTFTSIPVLFSKVHILGRVLCALFFLCLVFAGVSSLLSLLQVYVLAIKEFGVPHRIAVISALIIPIIIGLPSALSLDILKNQDNTWGYGLIISGLLFCVIVITYGPNRYRSVLINDFGINDIKVPYIWVPIVTFAVPLQTIALLVWWIYKGIQDDPKWYHITWDSLFTTLVEWIILLAIILIVNYILYRTKLLGKALERSGGCDPHDPKSYENPDTIVLDGIKVEAPTTNHQDYRARTRL